MQRRIDIEPKLLYQVHHDELIAKENFYHKLNASLDLHFLYDETA